tara:strand:+ start:679 stop:3411 length:2733 start_codon:yes stop_codon:yes gene_type:complete
MVESWWEKRLESKKPLSPDQFGVKQNKPADSSFLEWREQTLQNNQNRTLRRNTPNSAIGRIRDLGNPNDSRRNTSVPQPANISGLPTVAAEMAKAGKPLKSQWPMQTKGRSEGRKGFRLGGFGKRKMDVGGLPTGPNNLIAERKPTATPFNKQLGEGREEKKNPSNIGRLMKGEIKEGVVRDLNTGTTWKMNRDDFISGPKRGSQGPVVKEIADYGRGMGANPGEIEGVYLQRKQENPEFAGDPSNIKGNTTFYKDENAYGKINVLIRDKKRKITDRVNVNKGENRQVIRQTLDPKQVVETIDKDPDNLYNSERFEEKTLGKKMRDASNEFKTPTIGKTALVDYYKQGRYTHVSEMTPDQLKGVGINPAKVGTFAGVIDMGKIETSTTPLGNQQNKELQRLVYEAKGSDGDVLKTQRTIPVGKEKSEQVPEQLYRIGNPTAYDIGKVREAVAPFVGMEMKGEPKKEARKSISIDQVKELQKKGFTFRRVTEDGSKAVMLPPVDKNAPPMSVNDRLTQEINLTYDARSNRYFLNKDYETYEVGPTAFLTKPGTRVQRTRTGALRTGDVPDMVRKVAERNAPAYSDVVAGFDQIRKETIKSESAPPPPDVTAQGRRYIADQIVRSKELGYSTEQVQQLLDITPAGSAARKDLVNAVVERYQEISPNSAKREINLFAEEMTPLDKGTQRLREVLEERKKIGQPVNREQLYGLADLIGQRVDVSGNDLINEAGRRINEETRYISAEEKQEIVNDGKYKNGANGYQIPADELAIDKVGKDPIYTRGRGDVITNMPDRNPTRMPYDLLGVVPPFASQLPAEVEAIRSMAQADPTQQAGSVETSKTSMLNAPREQPMYGPVGRKPEERVLQNRAYTDNIQVKNYAQMARFLGREVGDPMQEKAMAAMAQRIAARLRR